MNISVTEAGPPVTMLWNEHAVPWVDVILALGCIGLTCCSTCGNAIAIRSILKLRARFSDRNNLGALTLIIFLNLAMCDFLQTLLSAPFAALMLFNGRIQPNLSPKASLILCNVAGVSYFIMSRASISIVALLSLVRCIVILRPMRHHAVVNYKNVMLALLVIWFCVTLLSTLPFMTGGTYKYWRLFPMCDWDKLEVMFPWHMSAIVTGLLVTLVYVSPFLLPGAIVIVCSVIIITALLIARQQKKILTRKKIVESKDLQDGITKKQLSAAITTLLIVVVFAFCYGMWWANSIMYLMWKSGMISTDGEFFFTATYGHTGYVYVATFGGLIMIYVNSAVNPIIYYCRIFSKTAKDYKTSSSGAKGPQSSSSFELSNRNSFHSVGVHRSNGLGTDTERMLQALSERDEGSEKDEETGDLVRFSQD